MTPELARPEPAPTGRSSVHRLLDAIDDLVRRHRALAAHDGGDDAPHTEALHTELIAAELTQQLAMMRSLPRQGA